MDDIRLCGLSGRSYVDPISNYSHVDNFDLGGEISSILKDGILPSHLYLQLIHELEHHRDMTSQAGNALAILWLRASDTASGRSESNRLCDLAKILAFHQYMRPWLEGKALFAQFDAFPGPSEILSLRSQNIFAYFIPRETVEWKTGTMKDLVDPVSRFLINRRVGNEAVNAKADLLISSADLEDGGYFTGYLACRRFVSICQSESKLARDSDFVIDYLHHFLLNDWYLTEILLTDQMSPDSAVAAVADHVLNRISFIGSLAFRRLISDELNEYEKANNGRLYTPDELYDDGKPALGSLFYDPNTCFDAYDVYHDWENWARSRRDAAALMNPRPFFRLGSAQGTLSIDEAGALTMDVLDDSGAWGLGAKTDLGHRDSTASEINIMLVPTMNMQFINFTSGGTFVFADLPESLEGTQAERDIRSMNFETASQQISIQTRKNILTTAVIESGDLLSSIALKHRTRVEASFKAFSSHYLLHPGHQLSKRTGALLQDSGLWGVVARDPIAVKTLAFLGVLGSCSDDATRKPKIGEDDLGRIALQFDADVRPEYLKELENRARASGLTLLLKWRDRYWSRL